MFERRDERILPLGQFVRRMSVCLAIAAALVAFALAVGIIGYHFLEQLPWVDSLLNAAMILTGMGPVDKLETTSAKLFASFYAIFSGLIFISLMGLLLSPIAHRVLHRFHMSDEDLNEGDGKSKRIAKSGARDRT